MSKSQIPQIRVGMTFGAYDATVKYYRGVYGVQTEENRNIKGWSEEVIRFKKTNLYASRVTPNDKGSSKTSSICFRAGAYTYSNNECDEKFRFNRIDAGIQYAVDKNGNGIVDEGEIYTYKPEEMSEDMKELYNL